MSQSSYLYMQTQTKHASWATKDSLIGQPIYCQGRAGMGKIQLYESPIARPQGEYDTRKDRCGRNTIQEYNSLNLIN